MRTILPVIVILALIGLIVYLAYKRPMEAEFLLDSDGPAMNLELTWLSFFRMKAETAPDGVHMRIYLFGMRILSRRMGEKKNSNLSLFKTLSLSDTCLRLEYSLDNPFLNGLAFIAAGMAGNLADITSLDQLPDFFPGREYLCLEGSSKLNLGRTTANFIRLKTGA